ncbi:MAG TPA: zinc ABC transporter substrate-binding protein, partial [Negativicutes bacterium]
MKRKMIQIVCLVIMTMVFCSGVSFAAFWDAKPTIVTTIYPLYEFTKQVVGDKAEVVLLVPAGAEPHDWEPAPQNLVTVQNAKLFIYVGAGMEPWIEAMGNSVLAGKKVVRAADYVNLLPAQYDEEGAPAADGAIDPHIWLDPV